MPILTWGRLSRAESSPTVAEQEVHRSSEEFSTMMACAWLTLLPGATPFDRGKAMRSRLVVLCLFVTASAATLWLPRLSTADNPNIAQVGKKIDNIAFEGEDAKPFKLHELKDKKAIVIVFLSFDCPVSTSYSQPLADMAKDFGPHGVVFLGLTTDQEETTAAVAKQAKEFKLPFAVMVDRKFAAADALKAGFTPEVFVLDGNYVLQYRGRIDDSFQARLKKNQQVTKQDLHQVLSEIVSGRPVSIKATEPIGCPILREKPAAAKVGNVTYYKDVLPILQKNCQACHRPGEVGPFSLMTYRQAVNWATDIKDYAQSRKMPPWKISEGVEYHNQRRLSDKDIAVLAAWADNGTPAGDEKDAPPPVKFAEGWKLGPPDLILSVSDDFQVGASGNDAFRCFVLPTNLTEDKYVEAVEVKPSNPRVVHHALCYIDTKGQGRALEKQQLDSPKKDPHGGNEQDKGPGYYGGMSVGFVPTSSLGGWAPGQLPHVLPEGTAISLPKGSDVVMQLHFHRTGRVEKDRTQIGVYFAKKKVERPYQGGFMMGIFAVIPAKNDHFVVRGSTTVTQDMVLHEIMPHMHMLGKDIKVTMTPPEGEGKATLLFHIKDWDYNWQETYYFKQPLNLKAGTKLELEAIYDNSDKNPNNPFSPPRAVTFGEQTTNEMCFVFFGGTSEQEGTRLPVTRPLAKKPKN
jgi:peroxiredoxin